MFGINKIISINLSILVLISFLLFFIFIRFSNNKEDMNEIIIFRIVISLLNTSSLFTSKIISNVFEKKEVLKKLKFLDVYEKLNNFLVFVFIFFMTPSLSYFHFYFLCSFIFNLYFSILFIIFFHCHDDKKNSELFEEKINEKKEVNNNQSTDLSKNMPKKKFSKRIKSKEVLTFGEDTNFSKSEQKGRLGKRKSSAKIMNNEKINLEKVVNGNDFSEKNNENNDNVDIENNMIVLTTNNNQGMSNNDNNNIQYQKQNIYIVNNIPISSSQRVLQENVKSNPTINVKNDLVTTKRKWKFICLILIPSKFLKYLFLFKLFLKTYSLKNVFSMKTHLLFYCGYFFLGLPVNFINNIIYAKIIKIKDGKKILLFSSFILSILSMIGYIFLFLNPLTNNQNKKIQFLLYVLFLLLNFFLKEGLIVVLRIFYTISVKIGFSKLVLRSMKEISIIFACLIFFGYYAALLFIRKSDKIFEVILYYIAYYFIPILFLIILFFNTIYIS